MFYRHGLWLRQSRQMPRAYEGKEAYESSEELFFSISSFLIKKADEIYKKFNLPLAYDNFNSGLMLYVGYCS